MAALAGPFSGSRRDQSRSTGGLRARCDGGPSLRRLRHCLGITQADLAGHELGQKEVAGGSEGLILFDVRQNARMNIGSTISLKAFPLRSLGTTIGKELNVCLFIL